MFMDIEKRSIQEHVENFETNPTIHAPEHEYVEWDGEHYAIKGNLYQKAKLKLRVFLYKAKKKSNSYVKRTTFTTLIKILDMKKDTFLRRIVKGDSFIGKLIFAFLDIIPLPNFHEIVKSVNKEYPDATAWEKVKLTFGKVDWTRTIVALAGAVLIVLEYADKSLINNILK